MPIGLEAAREAFFACRRSEALPFVLNDTVDVDAGDHAGNGGALVSVEGVEPLVYLVERGDGGGDVLVAATDLRLV